MLNSVFAERHFGHGEMNGFVTARSAAKHPHGIKGKAGVGAQQVDTVFACVTGMIRSPACFERHRPAALESQQRNGVIIHIEWLFGINLAPAPLQFSQTPWAE